MPNATDNIQRAKTALASVLPRSVNVETEQDVSDPRITVNDKPLRVEWIGEGWLRDVRNLLAHSRDRPDVVVARRMSPGARKALEAEGLSWVDETGAAEIAIDSIVVSRTGQPTEESQSWTPAVLAVVEAILSGTDATVRAVEDATGLSRGSCTNALNFLENRDLLISKADRGPTSGRQIKDPDRLLDAYAPEANALRSNKSLDVGISWRDPVAGLSETGETWDSENVEWACTGVIAASVLAPHLTSGATVDVYVDAESLVALEAVAAKAGLKPIEGGRLTLRPFPTVATQRLASEVQDLRIAPWPRVYADLRLVGVRGEDAAEHLRQVVMRDE